MNLTPLATIVWATIKMVGIIFLFVMPLASILTWMERRQSAMMQDRIGPTRANIGPFRLFGLVHILADGLKMFFKEDFVPAKAHRPLFTLAPVLAMAPVVIAFAIIPFGPLFVPSLAFKVARPEVMASAVVAGKTAVLGQVLSVDFGLLFYFAIASLSNYGASLAGWASYNKWALLGGLRASSQMMSYEVAMGLSILGAFLVYGTLEPGAMVAMQGPNPLHWGVVMQPVAFLLFFVAAMAETKRTPFDLPEGEPEIIGYFTEYSGMRFGMFFLGEFIEVVFAGAVVVTVFFGGWQVPFLHQDGFHIGDSVIKLWHLWVVLLQVAAFTFKVFFFCWLQLIIRWSLPRMRPDQLMALGWKRLLPLSLANIVVTAGVVLWQTMPK